MWLDHDTDFSRIRYPLLHGGRVDQDSEWNRYPMNLFENWTHDRVERSGILRSTHSETCSVHMTDVFKNGFFDKSDEDHTVKVENPRDYWDHLKIAVSSDYDWCLGAN